MPIRVLPAEVATRIAAGEVVERPASVVKELIENAIDAGAAEIRVEVNGGGLRKLRVLDDGCGIASAEVELAFARHSTSKLITVDDLEHIDTLGFRGEALGSIASVARVTLATRIAVEPVGTLLRIEGGRLVAREPSGRPSGTSVTVQDLFFNVPARRKFLRTERTERRHIDVLVTRYAMAYPHLRFSLTHDGRSTFQTNGSGDLQEVLVAVYGSKNAAQMVSVSPTEVPESDQIRVSGHTSIPSLQRSNRNEITLFVNGRWVQDQRLAFAVVQAYHTLLMPKRFPLAVLQVQIPAGDVDVNVHPAKTEVRFRDGDGVFRAVQRAVRRAVVDQVPAHEIHSTSVHPDTTSGTEWPGGWPSPEQLLRRARLRHLGAPHSQRQDRHENTQFALALGQPGSRSDPREMGPRSGREGAAAPTGVVGPGFYEHPALEQHTRQLPFLRVVGQLGLTYIVAEGPEGMYLIDQHAAHERVLYEQLMSEKTRAQVASQVLLDPLTVELTPDGISLVEDGLAGLLELGFDVDSFGGNTALVRAVPALLVNEDIQELFDDIVADFQTGEAPLAGEFEARIVRNVCKRAAIKAGQKLAQPEMDELLRQLESCASPSTCPHGRPTMIHLSAVQLALEFGRLG